MTGKSLSSGGFAVDDFHAADQVHPPVSGRVSDGSGSRVLAAANSETSASGNLAPACSSIASSINPVKPQSVTSRAAAAAAAATSQLLHSMLHPGSSTAPHQSDASHTHAQGSHPDSPPRGPTSNVPTSGLEREKQPSKPQQLLNKLKLGRRNVASAEHRDASTHSAPPHSKLSSLLLLPSFPGSDRPQNQTQSAIYMPSPLNSASRVTDDEEMEELSPYSSGPSNPLGPLLTPFRMMKPVAHKAVAGIKKPFRSKSPSALGASALNGAAAASDEVNEAAVAADCKPPMGYLWIWMGSFRRWQRRFIVASEAPGVLLMYKFKNRKGKVLSISLRNVDIHEDASDPRQLKIITPTGFIFLRTSSPEDQAQWLLCLRESVRVYRANVGLVEKLKDKGLLPQQSAAPLESEVTGKLKARTPGSSVGGGLVLPEVAELDLEQRKRVRQRLHEKLLELAPFQKEVERHMASLSSQLLAVVSGLNVRLPSLSASNSMMRLGSLQHQQPQQQQQHHPHQGTAALPIAPQRTTSRLAVAASPPNTVAADATLPLSRSPPVTNSPFAPTSTHPSSIISSMRPNSMMTGVVEGKAPAHWRDDGVAQPPPLPPPSRAADPSTAGVEARGTTSSHQVGPTDSMADSVRIGDGSSIEAPRWLTETTTTAAAARPMDASGRDAAAAPAAAAAGATPDGVVRTGSSTLFKFNPRLMPQKTQNLQQAFALLLEATRLALQSQAQRIAELETENMAYQSAMRVLKQQPDKPWQVRGTPRSTSCIAGGGAAAAAAASVTAAASTVPLSEGSDSDNDNEDGLESEEEHEGEREAELKTLDEDMMSVRTADEDAFDVVEPFDDAVDYSILDVADEAPASLDHLVPERTMSTSMRKREPIGTDEALEASTTVLSALEVVHQVDYVERLEGSKRITKVLATHEPPDKVPLDVCDKDEEDGEGTESDSAPDGYSSGGLKEAYSGRSKLPAPKPLGRGFSIWSLLKNMIGKDLTRLTMPATINEPTSTLQRLAEVLEYRQLLDQAIAQSQSVDRLLYVAVWNLTCYASQPMREGKPFNPLLGETYEWQSPDGDTKYVCEQVSHHPPVLAYIAESERSGWELQGELETRSKFWGKSAEVVLLGCESLKLKNWNEEYRWNRPNICVQDVILGNYWIEVYGKIRVTSSTGDVAVLTLKQCKRRMEDRGKLEGVISDAAGRQVWILSGSTAKAIYAEMTPAAAAERGLAAPPPPQQIWSREPYPADAAEQYWFTSFGIGLNDPADRIVPYLPPTDTRFRPDQRALEEGEWHRATTEKLRLEEKQRQVRRERNKLGFHYYPLWFRQVDSSTYTHMPDQPGFSWQFTGDYWSHRATKDWAVCPDLYSKQPPILVPLHPK